MTLGKVSPHTGKGFLRFVGSGRNKSPAATIHYCNSLKNTGWSFTWSFLIRWLGCVLILLGSLPITHLYAQDLQELEELLLNLPRNILQNQQMVNGQVYGGIINAIITDGDGILDNFSELDQINFQIISVRDNQQLTFLGTGEEFELFIEDEYETLLQIFFPNSLGEGTLGQDIARAHSQQLLFGYILSQDIKRDKIGGMIEYEWFEVDSTPGTALQGQFRVNPAYLSFQGRFSTLEDHLNTESYLFGLNFFPNIYLGTKSVDIWIGTDMFASGLYSRNNVFDLGLIDAGLGVWGSARRDFSLARIGVGAVFQGSKSFVLDSAIPDGYNILADNLSERGLDFNITYGAVFGLALSSRMSLNTKISENHSFERTAGNEVTSQTVVLVGINYFVTDLTPIDVGYKFDFGLDGTSASSIFIQGNYRW